ncbi:MAG: hypothetical protein ACYTEL_08740 [Planctomycetota bacterium]
MLNHYNLPRIHPPFRYVLYLKKLGDQNSRRKASLHYRLAVADAATHHNVTLTRRSRPFVMLNPGPPQKHLAIEPRSRAPLAGHPAGGCVFGRLPQASTTPKSQATLSSQPRGIQLEHRIKAVNTLGERPPNNTISPLL